jgi:hypothetical protein
MNKTQIKKRITEINGKIWSLRNFPFKEDQEISDLQKKLRAMEDKYLKEVRDPKLKELYDEKSDLEQQFKEVTVDLADTFDANQKKWWKEYRSGIDFGSGGVYIRAISPCKKYVIVTNKGCTAGTGTPMGTMGYYYAPTSHWLAVIYKFNYFDNRHYETEGRINKQKIQEMFDKAKQNNL